MVKCRRRHKLDFKANIIAASPNKLAEAAPQAWRNMCGCAFSFEAGIGIITMDNTA